jgi:glutamate racemase
VRARAFTRELQKRDALIAVYERAAPLLVPIIEHNELEYADEMLKKYLTPLIAKKIDTLILGCTHYPILKRRIKKMVGSSIRIISQDEIIGASLKDYLFRHKELTRTLSRRRVVRIWVTDITPMFRVCARRWFGHSTPLKKISLIA